MHSFRVLVLISNFNAARNLRITQNSLLPIVAISDVSEVICRVRVCSRWYSRETQSLGAAHLLQFYVESMDSKSPPEGTQQMAACMLHKQVLQLEDSLRHGHISERQFLGVAAKVYTKLAAPCTSRMPAVCSFAEFGTGSSLLHWQWYEALKCMDAMLMLQAKDQGLAGVTPVYAQRRESASASRGSAAEGGADSLEAEGGPSASYCIAPALNIDERCPVNQQFLPISRFRAMCYGLSVNLQTMFEEHALLVRDQVNRLRDVADTQTREIRYLKRQLDHERTKDTQPVC